MAFGGVEGIFSLCIWKIHCGFLGFLLIGEGGFGSVWDGMERKERKNGKGRKKGIGGERKREMGMMIGMN